MYLMYLLSLFAVMISGIGLFAPKSSEYLLFYPGILVSVGSLVLVAILWLLQILAAFSKWLGSTLLVLIGLALLGFSLLSILLPTNSIVSIFTSHMSTADDMVSFVLAIAYILSGMEHEKLYRSSDLMDGIRRRRPNSSNVVKDGNKSYSHHIFNPLGTYHRHDHSL